MFVLLSPMSAAVEMFSVFFLFCLVMPSGGDEFLGHFASN